MIDEVVLFLEGKQDSLLARLQREMVESAEHFNFETAARIRDRIVQVRRVTERQKVVWKSRLDMDLIAIARARGQACMQVFFVRGGKLIGQEHFILDGIADQPVSVLMGEFLKQFYTARTASAPEGRNVSVVRHRARQSSSGSDQGARTPPRRPPRRPFRRKCWLPNCRKSGPRSRRGFRKSKDSASACFSRSVEPAPTTWSWYAKTPSRTSRRSWRIRKCKRRRKHAR